MSNPLVRDRDIDFLLNEVFQANDLIGLPAFSGQSAETFSMYLESVRRLARDKLYPAYAAMDETPPELVDGKVRVHPEAKVLYGRLLELGVMTAERSEAVGGFQLPWTVTTAANLYLMAANLAAYGYVALTSGAAHLIEAFGSDDLKQRFMTPMYEGKWTGTMALTEPDAGSSLADLSTTATPTGDGHYLMKGSKIFISGGDQDITENVVHLTLARIAGAPAGIRGVSLFAVPAKRPTDAGLVDNDVFASQLIHKIGTRGLASVGLTYGERGDCHGYLVGPAGRGMACMFQMMNEARILVGAEGAATASVAYHESLAYAQERLQGRALSNRDPGSKQRAIIEHADVRRMLLRQKAIVEGAIALVLFTANTADRAQHSPSEAERTRLDLLLGMLTPVCKTFPAERGFESNTLAIQIHGGYGYTSEYPVESWWRDQKLNSLHEGTTGIQGLDLLGRKVIAGNGQAFRVLAGAIGETIAGAEAAGVEAQWGQQLGAITQQLANTTMTLGGLGMGGDAEGMLLHSADYLEAFSTVIVAWLWLQMAIKASDGLKGRPDDPFYQGKLQAAQYYFATELPKVGHLLNLCVDGESSYRDMAPEWF